MTAKLIARTPEWEEMVYLLGGDVPARRVANSLERGGIRTPEQLVEATPGDVKDCRWMGPKSYERAMSLRQRLIDARAAELIDTTTKENEK